MKSFRTRRRGRGSQQVQPQTPWRRAVAAVAESAAGGTQDERAFLHALGDPFAPLSQKPPGARLPCFSGIADSTTDACTSGSVHRERRFGPVPSTTNRKPEDTQLALFVPDLVQNTIYLEACIGHVSCTLQAYEKRGSCRRPLEVIPKWQGSPMKGRAAMQLCSGRLCADTLGSMQCGE
ncbi:uncharacterized protein LOC123804703 isoform X2 [Phyllostomus hastatus]|nr:uncharacterized protein LOC123804703 isoform X2 [Phyllostomus hastatus]